MKTLISLLLILYCSGGINYTIPKKPKLLIIQYGINDIVDSKTFEQIAMKSGWPKSSINP